MKITDAIARLVRAGDRNSKAWQKTSDAVDEFVKWLATILPGGGERTLLPRGYIFSHWPSMQYRLIKMQSGEPVINLAGQISDSGIRPAHDIIHTLRLCEDIQSGFLDEVNKYLDQQSEKLELAAASLDLAQKKSERL